MTAPTGAGVGVCFCIFLNVRKTHSFCVLNAFPDLQRRIRGRSFGCRMEFTESGHCLFGVYDVGHEVAASFELGDIGRISAICVRVYRRFGRLSVCLQVVKQTTFAKSGRFCAYIVFAVCRTVGGMEPGIGRFRLILWLFWRILKQEIYGLPRLVATHTSTTSRKPLYLLGAA